MLISENIEVKAVFNELVKMRISIKKKPTKYAKELLWAKLGRLSNNDPVLAIEILNQSIENCWSGVFPLRQAHKQKQPPVNIMSHVSANEEAKKL